MSKYPYEKTWPQAVRGFLEQEGTAAQVLRQHGELAGALALERVASRLETLIPAPWLTWHSERDTAKAVGKSVAWLRTRFARWARQGLAYREGRQRVYSGVVLQILAPEPVPDDDDLVRLRQLTHPGPRLSRKVSHAG